MTYAEMTKKALERTNITVLLEHRDWIEGLVQAAKPGSERKKLEVELQIINTEITRRRFPRLAWCNHITELNDEDDY